MDIELIDILIVFLNPITGIPITSIIFLAILLIIGIVKLIRRILM